MKFKYTIEVLIKEFNSKGIKVQKLKPRHFIEDNPIVSRHEAISHYKSYLDIFEEAQKHENIHLYNSPFYGNKLIQKYKTVEVNLKLSVSKTGVRFLKKDELELFGNYHDSFEERIDALQDELSLYLDNNFEIKGIQKIKIEGNDKHILNSSLIKFSDGEFLQS